jgi:hypothetical protein
VYPSFIYILWEDGEFKSSGGGGQCESFERKVERDAVAWELWTTRRWRRDYELMGLANGKSRELREWARAEPVPEASDKYTACWTSRNLVLFERRKTVTVWVAPEARERVVDYLRGLK